MQQIDLRSDTVTRPSPAMRTAMHEAEVGDDVWGDDPTVQRLEALAATMFDKEAAVFVSSGTQSNLCGLMAHCQRGDEYIVGEVAHTYRYEGGGAAVLGSIQPQPVRMLESGMVDLDHVDAVVKPDDVHFARSRVLCIENTHDGKVIGMDELTAGRSAADRHGLRYHLDGARVANAAVALDLSPAEVVAPFDSVSVCLSKGLGAPVGSVLLGSADLITEARKWRKMLGGGMRQAGILAAAGIYALEHNVDRLADDHANATALADRLGALASVTVTGQSTNMVFAEVAGAPDTGADLEAKLATEGILVAFHGNTTRMVTHLDVNEEGIDAVVDAFRRHLD